MNIQRLSGSSGLRRFVSAPWTILDSTAFPQWVPPLRMSVHGILHPKKNPFFRNADRALFLAEERGRAVGRVAAIHNGWALDAGKDPGFVGFFECVDDHDVAGALLSAAEAWVKERGSARVTGPLNPSTNYEGGVLIEGFEHPQTFLTPWNPSYYPALFEGAGYVKGADLLGWHVSVDNLRSRAMDRFARLAEGAGKRLDLTFGPIDFSDFDRVMHRCWEIYSECWSAQWGFVPLAADEWRFIAHEMKPLMVPEGTLVVRSGGEIVGFGLFLPDYNRAMAKDRSGRLLPLNWLRLLRARSRSPWVRVMLAGVLPRYRRLGLLPVLLHEASRKADDFGVVDVEASWILEDNHDLNLFFRRMGADPYRVWRVYEKRLDANG
ncbi:MAG TPA: GNAT family N-acetyltransferase [Longimicrobiales bacterium]|nr:GNAT family N-acetyltransferase [Longimicrobiales bacterium]